MPQSASLGQVSPDGIEGRAGGRVRVGESGARGCRIHDRHDLGIASRFFFFFFFAAAVA